MITLNAGNLFTATYLDKVIELNKKFKGNIQVTSLFGSIGSLTPTARAVDRLPSRSWDFLEEYISRAKAAGIDIRYTLNASCLGSLQDFKGLWDYTLKGICRDLHNIGVDQWTVTSSLLMILLREMFPADMIEVSTICEVSTPEDISRWMNLGADAVCLSTSINRNFALLKVLSSTPNVTLSLLANEACLYKCPFRRDCYSLSSHNSWRSEELFNFFPFRYCNEVRLAHPEEWLRSRLILPQWMLKYEQLTGINNFKVAYRTHPEEVAIPLLEVYMNKYFGGNLCALWPTISRLGNTPEPKDVTFISCDKMDKNRFIEKWLSGDTCSEQLCGVDCHYCHNMYEKCKDGRIR